MTSLDLGNNAFAFAIQLNNFTTLNEIILVKRANVVFFDADNHRHRRHVTIGPIVMWE